MKRFILAFLLLPRLALAQSPSPESAASLLLTHVTVIDATGALPKPDMTVHIRNHRIVAVRPSSATAPNQTMKNSLNYVSTCLKVVGTRRTEASRPN